MFIFKVTTVAYNTIVIQRPAQPDLIAHPLPCDAAGQRRLRHNLRGIRWMDTTTSDLSEFAHNIAGRCVTESETAAISPIGKKLAVIVSDLFDNLQTFPDDVMVINDLNKELRVTCVQINILWSASDGRGYFGSSARA